MCVCVVVNSIYVIAMVYLLPLTLLEHLVCHNITARVY